MKNKIASMLSVLLAAVMITSTVSAGGNVRLSGGVDNVTWSLGSLVADATLVGLGKTDVTANLEARGLPVIICTNYGSNDVPGHSYPKITASGKQELFGDDVFRRNGKSPFRVKTEDLTISWSEAGCPNPNWSARINFVFWTDATITVKDLASGEVLFEQFYECLTTRNPDTVSCRAVR